MQDLRVWALVRGDMVWRYLHSVIDGESFKTVVRKLASKIGVGVNNRKQGSTIDSWDLSK